MGDTKSGTGIETLSKEKVRVKRPKQFKVILLNDDYTTMDFVVSILETIFKKTPAEAMQIMLRVHKRGQGVAGIYTREIAEAKIVQVHERARSEAFPLRCTIEEA
jgi:ATP-dependent Clp protease adaptor protein ClpS